MSSTVRSLKYATNTGNVFANNQATVDVLMIGGGGAGGSNNSGAQFSGQHGGGAGGLVWRESFIVPIGSYTITIGAGGAAATSLTTNTQAGAIGNNTTFGSLLTAFAGGGVSSDGYTSGSLYGGGSEGGHISLIPNTWNGGGGSRFQGNPVNNKASSNNSGIGGGGVFGASQGGGSAGQFQGGWGGPGTGEFDTWLAATSTGQSVTSRRYIGGGGGGGHAIYYGTPYNRNDGGVGGGGMGGYGTGTNATAADANTGGGGGGGGSNGTNGSLGGNGGSGLCIIRYLTGTISATGGTEVTSGGYRYHTFTSTGTWTRTA
jgi:hypothetical protein